MTDPENDLVVVEDPELQYKLDRLEDIKAEISALNDEATVLTFEIEAKVRKAALFTNHDGITMRASVVRGTTVTVDLGWFQRNDPEVYEQITKPKVDNDALKRLLRSGRIGSHAAQAAIKVSDNKPSVKFTVVGSNEEDETG